MDFEPIPFSVLSGIVYQILEDCDEDVVCTRMRLTGLEPRFRDAILTSDLLNAWQVFFYFFQEYPNDEAREILSFTPASSLAEGVSIGEYRDCLLTFVMDNARPTIIISDDLQEMRRFSGAQAYRQAINFIDSE
jgi:hypothetical protein